MAASPVFVDITLWPEGSSALPQDTVPRPKWTLGLWRTTFLALRHSYFWQKWVHRKSTLAFIRHCSRVGGGNDKLAIDKGGNLPENVENHCSTVFLPIRNYLDDQKWPLLVLGWAVPRTIPHYWAGLSLTTRQGWDGPVGQTIGLAWVPRPHYLNGLGPWPTIQDWVGLGLLGWATLPGRVGALHAPDNYRYLGLIHRLIQIVL